MTLFLANIGLGLLWAVLTGVFSPPNLAIGFVLGYLMLWMIRGVLGPSRYYNTVPRLFEFAGYFLWELILANGRLAVDVLTPAHRMRPRVIALPLAVREEGEITLLANLISLTPGSLTLDVSEDHRFLYIHAMYASDPEAVRRSIQEGLERRILELMHGSERNPDRVH